jgi:hypothetical protein
MYSIVVQLRHIPALFTVRAYARICLNAGTIRHVTILANEHRLHARIYVIQTTMRVPGRILVTAFFIHISRLEVDLKS